MMILPTIDVHTLQLHNSGKRVEREDCNVRRRRAKEMEMSTTADDDDYIIIGSSLFLCIFFSLADVEM